ncbi:hypothetical protein [Psychrobacillus sp. OK032]|uniref:hypothetical protein n=1 Tax=Psychrobacillus sp. OK032 TaxID=1884358 RepID=UPI0008C7B231|nr:hypothetical protein [Psychrobacillus sp. OK032]SER51424.1 hypothetical protein SAMN05518872_10111 [Psychrobacillus sp. OK032]
MYLILFTIVYCFITQLINISYGPALGIFLVTFGFLKGFFSNTQSNFLNLESSKKLYKKNGFKDSLIELISLVLVYINSYLIDYEPFTLFEFVFLFASFAILYRFLFWGITRTFKERESNR